MTISEESFFLHAGYRGTLQSQIRQQIATAVVQGKFLPGERLPSSRKLAVHLGISRITVTLAYQDLIADGYLDSRQRSGIFVAKDAPKPDFPGTGIESRDTVRWDEALCRRYTGARLVRKVEDWRRFRFPFVYGQADPELFSHSQWRQCALQTLGKREFDNLASDLAERDDPELVAYIARQTLPRRGILARPEQILVTAGAQNALWTIAQLLLGPGRVAVHENPGYPDLREIIRLSNCILAPQDVDASGLDPSEIPDQADVVFTTPSHQAPTAATMPMGRRRDLLTSARERDFIVVEDDYEFEMSFLGSPLPALKSLDEDGRVIYVGSFSKSLFPGLRLGFLVASEPLIREARALRTTVLRHLPGHIQRTTARFLALGHYDALISRMKDAYCSRHQVMLDAIRNHDLEIVGKGGFGGSCFWMRAPVGIDTDKLATMLETRGVLIEPGEPFFSGHSIPRNYFRLAYSSINEKRIPEGIRLIRSEIDAHLVNGELPRR